jgi:hypothetical protein
MMTGGAAGTQPAQALYCQYGTGQGEHNRRQPRRPHAAASGTVAITVANANVRSRIRQRMVVSYGKVAIPRE